MNERDSEDVAYKLKEKGYEIVSDEKIADVVLLNTCSVREQAELKAIGKAGHLLRSQNKNTRPIVGVMGCMAQNRGADLFDHLPDLDLVVGTQKFHRVPQYVDSLIDGVGDIPKRIVAIEDEEGSESEIKDHLDTEIDNPTAFVSIMQGCNMNCSFCIVPKTRGKERYRTIESIVEECRELADRGIREVTLLGQIVNAYGRGSFRKINNKTPFVQLLESIDKIDGLERIRFTSPHPISFGEDLINCYKTIPSLCEYVHLPMQSGSDRILKLMNRPYSRERFLEIAKKLREVNPKMRLSTDIIVGFPDETENDFELTKSAFEEVNFEMAFIFKYSERKGTPAVSFNNHVPREVKEQRNQVLLSLLEKQSLKSNNLSIGKRFQILVESKAKRGVGKLMGRTRCNRKVIYDGENCEIGQMVNVQISSATSTTLFGEKI